MFEKGKTIQVVNECLFILVHNDIFDGNGEMVLNGSQGIGQFKIGDYELFELFIFHYELIDDDLMTHLAEAIIPRIGKSLDCKAMP